MADAALHVPASSLEHLDEQEVRQVLKRLKPRFANAAPGCLDIVARVVSVVWDVIGELPKAKRGELFDKDILRAAILEISAGGLTGHPPALVFGARPEPKLPGRVKLKDTGEVEHSRVVDWADGSALQRAARG